MFKHRMLKRFLIQTGLQDVPIDENTVKKEIGFDVSKEDSTFQVLKSLKLPIQEITKTNVVIGNGAAASVSLGKYTKLNNIVAIKKFKSPPHRRPLEMLCKKFSKEILIEAKIHSQPAPNIVKVYGYCNLESTPIIISEYMANASLDEFIKKNPQPRNTLKWIFDLTAAVKYLHEVGVLHRDIKPANVLFDHNYNLKLADFDLATFIKERGSVGGKGTPFWMAPEAFNKMSRIFQSSDIYSLALVLWSIVAWKRYPYVQCTNIVELKEVIFKGYREKIPEDCSGYVRILIARGWELDPINRPTAAEMLEVLTAAEEPTLKITKRF